ncbi:Gfo/Idh/MocA family protein, partial [Actinomadura logoneensis]|uniref:Gfo/Idh/MocA family protein n=1 Tax=Actinomadura logoneensis TaxID=2293572 RepID=UPI001314E6C1
MRVGVLGGADIAWRRTLPALTAEPGVRVVAVASRSGRRAARFAERFGCAAVTGYDALLARDDIDAVYVPLPAGLLHRWTRAALDSGRHVLAEKPLGEDGDQARDLVACANARGLVLMENVAFQLHPQHDVVRSLLAEGAVGEPREFRAVFGIPPLPGDDVRYRPDLGGGALLDLGFYPLRAARMFLGAGLEVAGARLRPGPSGVDVAGSALLAAPDGTTASVSFGFEHAYRSTYELWGSAGRVRAVRAFTPPPDHRPRITVDGPGGRRVLEAPAADQFALLAADFAAAVRTGRDLR